MFLLGRLFVLIFLAFWLWFALLGLIEILRIIKISPEGKLYIASSAPVGTVAIIAIIGGITGGFLSLYFKRRRNQLPKKHEVSEGRPKSSPVSVPTNKLPTEITDSEIIARILLSTHEAQRIILWTVFILYCLLMGYILFNVLICLPRT
jgi:hypothetical protein